ncbi:C40 family peptidase [Paenibacillus athensensis]|uniref:NlpC/P60 domain-containing protein n=1 Tax=Paenibacillus athensensis TaxID=1967502 RepID=A0A4Y8PX40_9BACL|nr:C40 family peptidase [Paenibacillus athensensis]MCD1258831.1 C40 family peptidase [Paenibacillus athensensis]
MFNLRKQVSWISLAALVAITGCGSDQAAPGGTVTPNAAGAGGRGTVNSLVSEGGGMQMLATNDAVVPIQSIHSVSYVSAQKLAEVLKFRTRWEQAEGRLQIGDNDASYELLANSAKAVKDGNELQVSEPFLLQQDKVYIPVSALGDLFQEEMTFDIRGSELRIHPAAVIPTADNEDSPDAGASNAGLEFGEDPTDPFKAGDTSNAAAWSGEEAQLALAAWAAQAGDDAVPVLKNIDINAMIQKGKQYLGVKYLFGAAPYPQSGRFDCSTFTQYVYGKYGVKLPRLARQQATTGTLVSRKNLRRGDLMFFYVPGRFKTNRTVGHVGIYIGNMQMLHASPEPKNGVQISSINKAYWKETFLRAKRVAY